MNWGKFWQISIKNKVYLIFGCTQIFQKVFLCMNIRYHIIGVLLTRLCVFTSKYWGKYSINFVLNDCLKYSAEDMTMLILSKTEEIMPIQLCQYNYSLPIYDYFCVILRANFGQKYKQKLCIFAYFYIFWEKYN